MPRDGAALAVVAWRCLGVSAPAHAAGELCAPGVVFDDADVLDDRTIARFARSAFEATR